MNREQVRTVFVCEECGAQSPKWEGRCVQCAQWNTLVAAPGIRRPNRHGWALAKPAQVRELSQIAADIAPRVSTGSDELNRLLGGGLVVGSLVLLAGDPGIGKSTLLLQASAHFAGQGQRVLYVSGEESGQQVKLRADRLGISGEHLLFLSGTEVDEILDCMDDGNLSLAVVDSVQTLFCKDMPSAAGTIAQVRESTRRLMQWTKDRGIPLLLAGHVTKDGTLAGPRMLEHIVDVVLYLEGDMLSPYRILRSVKNRFGSTNEIGVFVMGDHGLVDVQDPSMLFLSLRSEAKVGSAIIAAQKGSRPLLAEVQALTTPTVFAQPRRTASGVDFQRLVLVAAVLSKRMRMPLAGQDIIVNIAGGLRVEGPAADLGMALALASSFQNVPCQPETVVIGEVGLGGEIRSVPQVERRLSEAARLGFKTAIVPESQEPDTQGCGMQVVPVATLGEAILKSLVLDRRQERRKK